MPLNPISISAYQQHFHSQRGSNTCSKIVSIHSTACCLGGLHFWESCIMFSQHFHSQPPRKWEISTKMGNLNKVCSTHLFGKPRWQNLKQGEVFICGSWVVKVINSVCGIWLMRSTGILKQMWGVPHSKRELFYFWCGICGGLVWVSPLFLVLVRWFHSPSPAPLLLWSVWMTEDWLTAVNLRLQCIFSALDFWGWGCFWGNAPWILFCGPWLPRVSPCTAEQFLWISEKDSLGFSQATQRKTEVEELITKINPWCCAQSSVWEMWHLIKACFQEVLPSLHQWTLSFVLW